MLCSLFSRNLVLQLTWNLSSLVPCYHSLEIYKVGQHITTRQVQLRQRGQGASGELPPSCWLAIILQKARLLYFLERWDANLVT